MSSIKVMTVGDMTSKLILHYVFILAISFPYNISLFPSSLLSLFQSFLGRSLPAFINVI